MKFNMTVTCDVCGCEGQAISLDCLDWSKFKSHRDPRVCAENIKRRKNKQPS